jgi:solute carrier family 25 protein 39/40
MWRGTGPALAMSVPGQVIYMLGYDYGRRTAFDQAPTWAYVPTREVDGLRVEERKLRASYLTCVPLIAGGVSRTFVAALVSPVELLRTRLQSSTTGTTIPAIFYAMKANGGWRSAWKGLPATLWRDVPFSGIYWASYEGFKRTLTGGKGMGESSEDQTVGEEFAIAFISGAGSGMVRPFFLEVQRFKFHLTDHTLS